MRCGSEPAEDGCDRPGRVRGIGGLLTVRDDQGRAVPALDGHLDKDGRRVLLHIESPGWERERYGDAGATARKLRTLAETLVRHADTISERCLPSSSGKSVVVIVVAGLGAGADPLW
jgi:hypothetical protein